MRIVDISVQSPILFLVSGPHVEQVSSEKTGTPKWDVDLDDVRLYIRGACF
jgi:hypothetical protein